MRYLLSDEGRAAITELMARQPLLGFDFDGTLAPIVADPSAAQATVGVGPLLSVIARRVPVAVISGRALADLRSRLPFEPHYVLGSHGAEDAADPRAGEARTRALEPLRVQLAERAGPWAAEGIVIEDKGVSIAIHYRRALDARRAAATVRNWLRPWRSTLDVFAGKRVLNVTAPDAPDKADAMRALVARSGAACALFVGDDLNDEPVFRQAPANWLTVRIGHAPASSAARYYLRGPAEVVPLLEWVVRCLPGP